MMCASRWLLLLGSNLDHDRRVHDALGHLAALGQVDRLSAIRHLPAHGDSTSMYYNVLVALSTTDHREHLDAQLKRIEQRLGRQRDRAEEVAIDIDILARYADHSWQADARALNKGEFARPPVLTLLRDAGVEIAPASLQH